MRTCFLLLSISAACAAANAGDVRFFFTSSADAAGLQDTTHAFDNIDGNGTDRDSYQLNGHLPAIGVPSIDSSLGEFLYLWVEFENEKNGRTIQGINLVVNSEDFNGHKIELDRGMYLGQHDQGFGEKLRWNSSSKTTDTMTLVGVSDAPGIVNQTTDGWLYMGSDSGRRVALLGALKFGGNDEQFDGHVRDEPDYYWSSDADAHVDIPEPATVLLFIAALALRRRR